MSDREKVEDLLSLYEGYPISVDTKMTYILALQLGRIATALEAQNGG